MRSILLSILAVALLCCGATAQSITVSGTLPTYAGGQIQANSRDNPANGASVISPFATGTGAFSLALQQNTYYTLFIQGPQGGNAQAFTYGFRTPPISAYDITTKIRAEVPAVIAPTPYASTAVLRVFLPAGANGTKAGYIVGFDTSGYPQTATSPSGYGGIASLTAAAGTMVEVERFGINPCVFDGAATIGDAVVPSTTTLGQCHDAGVTAASSIPSSTPIVGVVQTAAAGAGAVGNVRQHSPGSFGGLITTINGGTCTVTGTGSNGTLVCNSIMYGNAGQGTFYPDGGFGTSGHGGFGGGFYSGLTYQVAEGSVLASAATMTPITGIFHISGTTAISTFNAPTSFSNTIIAAGSGGAGGCVYFITDSALVINSGTAFGSFKTGINPTVAGKLYQACLTPSTGLWYF